MGCWSCKLYSSDQVAIGFGFGSDWLRKWSFLVRTAWKETKSKPKEIKDFFFDFQLKIAVTGRCDYCKVFNQFLCLGPGLGRGLFHSFANRTTQFAVEHQAWPVTRIKSGIRELFSSCREWRFLRIWSSTCQYSAKCQFLGTSWNLQQVNYSHGFRRGTWRTAGYGGRITALR